MENNQGVGLRATDAERREDVRVAAAGSAIVYGRRTVRGRLVDMSAGGLRLRVEAPVLPFSIRVHAAPVGPALYEVGERVDLELHLDRAGSRWLQFHGAVVRADEHEVAVALTSVPLEFADVVKDALVTQLEGLDFAHVLLVDGNLQRRQPFAALLRHVGCRVVEVSTPLEAIAHLGHAAVHRWTISIAETDPPRIAAELHHHLVDSNAPVDVRILDTASPTSALSWFTTTSRSSQESSE